MNFVPLPSGSSAMPEHPVTVASATLEPAINNNDRGLLFYPVSIENLDQQGTNLYASIGAIKNIVDSRTRVPHLILHITDAIYAFNYMIEDPQLTSEDARARAIAKGAQWVQQNYTIWANEFHQFMPIVMYWRQWDDKHGDEYCQVLKQLTDMCTPAHPTFNKAFYDKVHEDSESYISRHLQLSDDADVAEVKRIRELSEQFVVHECTGYVLIGRHLIGDYLEALKTQEPLMEQTLRQTGSFERIYRLYPNGGELKSIKWLRANPEIVTGVQKTKTVSINIKEQPLAKDHAFRPLHSVQLPNGHKTSGRNGKINPGPTKAVGGHKYHIDFPVRSYDRPRHHRAAGLGAASLAALKAS